MTARVVVVVGLCAALAGCVQYLAPQCNDQIRNGDESGIDCGGSCGRCPIGGGCRADTDCEDATCAAGVCTALPCENGVRDGRETDVDCGGGACRKCAGGRQCEIDGDCSSGACDPTTLTCSALSVSFADEVRYFSGFKSYAVLAADLDGDGQTGLAVINEYGSSVAVFHHEDNRGALFTRVDNPAGKPRTSRIAGRGTSARSGRTRPAAGSRTSTTTATSTSSRPTSTATRSPSCSTPAVAS
jgi:hypothetical protein